MPDIDMIDHRLKHGAEFPYDAPDSWWHASIGSEKPPATRDWTHAAARGILADLGDRRDIKRGFEHVNEDVRAEIAETLAAIIRAAHTAAT